MPRPLPRPFAPPTDPPRPPSERRLERDPSTSEPVVIDVIRIDANVPGLIAWALKVNEDTWDATGREQAARLYVACGMRPETPAGKLMDLVDAWNDTAFIADVDRGVRVRWSTLDGGEPTWASRLYMLSRTVPRVPGGKLRDLVRQGASAATILEAAMDAAVGGAS